MSRRHSEDPYSASRGGFIAADVQTRARDLQSAGLGAAWRTTIDSLDVGEISMPTEATLLDETRTPVVHFVLLQRRTAPHTLAIEDDYALLSQYALQEKQNRTLGEPGQRAPADGYGTSRRTGTDRSPAADPSVPPGAEPVPPRAPRRILVAPTAALGGTEAVSTRGGRP